MNSGPNKVKKAKLILEDGSEYCGESFGYESSASGEVVFNTGMVGYPETLTDPSYKGQILVLTYPLIGNYGVPEFSEAFKNDFESDRIHVMGLIVCEYSNEHNHWNSKYSLSEWLKNNNVPAITCVDTRALTKKLREKGTMLGKIVFGDDDMENNDMGFDDPNQINLVEKVSIGKPVIYGKESAGCEKKGKKIKTIILVDCGCKYNIIRNLVKLTFVVKRVPWNYDFTNEDFDGVFISNGPGNPKQCKETIEILRKAIEIKKPIFGICLGNQLLALAAGADTYKLKYGHRSQNQPCVEAGTKRCYITSQNHGYAIDEKTLPAGWKVWFNNANDSTVEGIMHESGLFKSVQFHPEHFPGPTDTNFLFELFKRMIEAHGKNDKNEQE